MVLVTDDEITHGDAVTRVCPRHEALGREPLVEEVERADGFERAPKAVVVGKRAVPEGTIGGPLRGRRLAPSVVLGAGHDGPTGGRAHDRPGPGRAATARPL